VIFGATGDLAKLETFPALVSLVDRGVLDVPVVGIGRSGWGWTTSATTLRRRYD
jgi:glucose-6-phosphate 1-dehydrogenase